MFIVGHSHMNCIIDAAQMQGAPVGGVNLWVFDTPIIRTGPEPILNPALAERMQPVTISAVGGGEHHVLCLNLHPLHFDFVLPQAPQLPLTPGARLIPYDQIRATLLETSLESVETLRCLANAAPGRLIHLAPPPVRRDEQPIDHPLWRSRVGAETAISPAHLRLKFSIAYTGMLKELCAELGVRLAPPPPDVVDPDGYLLPEFGGNPCHGNTLYGARVLDQLATMIG